MRRSMLFIPGNSPGMLLNADVFRADSIILDLEDAVSPNEKDSARILVRNALKYLEYSKSEVIIRINSLGTRYWKDDIDAVVPFKPKLLMPTKVNSQEDIITLSNYVAEIEEKNEIERNSIGFMPLLETALGIENAFSIALSSPRIIALYLGAEDLTADLRARRTKEGLEIDYSRGRLIMAARAAGKAAYDTPFTDVDDEEGLQRDAEIARTMGFDGKAVISPRHVDCINRVFSPTQAEVEYALEVLEAIEQAKKQGKGAVSLRGKMIDAPIVERAKHVVAMMQELSGGGKHE